jgi:hypothetical protein
MSKIQWAICVAHTDARNLIQLKQLSELYLAEQADLVWVKGYVEAGDSQSQLESQLKSISGCRRFRVIDRMQLLADGKRVPDGYLPDADWIPLKDWIEIRFPSTSLVGHSTTSVPLQLVREISRHASGNQQPTMLLCQQTAWTTWAASASKLRLQKLSFACNASDQALIRGNPLPPIPGKQLIEYGRVAIPTGWSWRPDVSVETLNQILNVRRDTIVVMSEDSRWQVLKLSQFVAASRSGARLTSGGQ